ncbi:MAG: hypothetical protein ACXVCP_07675 [Bdellovibrio sp.]
MKKNLFILYATVGFGLALSAANTAQAAPSLFCNGMTVNEINKFTNENNLFLLKLGFGDLARDFQVKKNGTMMASKIENGPWLDLSDLMVKYKENKFTYNTMTGMQLDQNIRAYKAVKSAKELALYLSALSLPCIQEGGHREALAELTAYLMKMKPLDLTESVESEVKAQLSMDLKTASDKNPDQVNQILETQLKKAIRSHSQHLTNVLMYSLFKEDLLKDASMVQYKNDVEKDISRLTLPIVKLAYMDHQIGRTQWLGRALIGLQLRNGGVDALPVLKKELAQNGVVIENYAGETWLLDTENSGLGEAENAFTAELTKLYSEHKISLSQVLQMRDQFDKRVSSLITEKDIREQQDSDKQNVSKVSLKERLSLTMKNSLAALKNQKWSTTKEWVENVVDKALVSMKGVSDKLGSALSYKTTQMQVPVHTMSYLLTRNINFESAETPSLALPGNVEIGKQYNLIGSLLSGINVIDAEYVAENGYGAIAQLKDKSFYRVLNNGFSHVGYVAVRRADGVSMTWVIDNYPTPVADNEMVIPGRFNSGGVRWVGLEQFYKASQHSRISIMTPDAAMFHEYAKPSIEAWMKKINAGEEILGTRMFDAISPVLDASGKPTKVAAKDIKDDPWTMEIDSATFKKIHQHEDSNEWFESVTDAALTKIQDFMYRGVAFVWITPYGQYYKGGAYCSFTGILGYGLGTGLNPLSTGQDKWSNLILGLAKIHESASKKLQTEKNPTVRAKLQAIVDNESLQNAATATSVIIYTPSGLPSQWYVPKKNVYQAQAPFRNVFSRYDLLFDKTSKVTEEVSLTSQGSEAKEMITPIKLDRSETTGILLDLLEVTDVKYSAAK